MISQVEWLETRAGRRVRYCPGARAGREGDMCPVTNTQWSERNGYKREQTHVEAELEHLDSKGMKLCLSAFRQEDKQKRALWTLPQKTLFRVELSKVE